MQFLQLIVTETVVKILSLFTKGILSFFVKRVLLSMEDWRPAFHQSEEVVWLLYFTLIIWFSIILMPLTAIVHVVLLYVIFKVYYIFITVFAKKVQSQSNKVVSRLASMLINFEYRTPSSSFSCSCPSVSFITRCTWSFFTTST